MLVPKKTKYRKMQKGRIKGRACRGNKLVHGDYGIVALEPSYITNNQIEAARIVMSRNIKKIGKMWITIFPDKPITKKPAETRMGSGKGNPEYFVAVVKPGRVMFEISGLDEATSKEVLRKAIQKLPIKCKIISKEEQLGGSDNEIK